MSIFDAVAAFFGGNRKSDEREQREEHLRAAFKARCRHFKALLSANKRALESMAALEEALRGEQHFGMSFVRAHCTTVLTNVFNMVRHLNGLTENAHAELFERLKDIQQRITDAVSPKEMPEGGPFVLALTETDLSLSHEVGGKMASLGEAWKVLGQEIPDGFVITASGYRRFVSANDLQEEINRRIQMTDLSRLENVFALSSSLQQLIIASPVPEDLARAVHAQMDALEVRAGGPVRLAVRSSAIGEDSLGASFAGQYRSDLNVTRESLLDTYKEVVASKYGVTAMTYRTNRGIPDDEIPMCVGCLSMVDALAGGVAYSRDPMNGEAGVIVNAVPGLPKTVVDGSGEVDVFRVSREVPHVLLDRHIAVKSSRVACAPGEGTVVQPLARDEGGAPSLSDEQAVEVARVALGFEVFYGVPQDVEWAYTREGRLIILQSRALPGVDKTAECPPPPADAEVLMEGGVSAAPGVGTGRVVVVRRNADMLGFSPGAVLVVEQAHARWAPILSRASAVVSEYGGAAGHLAGVAREYGVPALFGLSGCLKGLEGEGMVTVDADARRVYAGTVEAVLARKRTPRVIFAGSPVHAALARAAQHIVPLHLLDPDSSSFSPAHCESLHDITRFCHEKAVEEMFRLDESLFSTRCGKQLRYRGGKLQYFVVNIEDGFCKPVEGRYVDIEDICCAPMLALWEGMLAVPWSGPPVSGGRGLLSVVAESASNPDLEVTSASSRMSRNYFMVDRHFCNLQASFGYHFCTVEAQAGEVVQENYVSFHFKGGGANAVRRMLRIGALDDVLTENGFIVDVKEDTLSARAEELTRKEALNLLNIIGFILIHSRQADAGLSGEASRRYFADDLRRGIEQTKKVCGKKGE